MTGQQKVREWGTFPKATTVRGRLLDGVFVGLDGAATLIDRLARRLWQ